VLRVGLRDVVVDSIRIGVVMATGGAAILARLR
jgi:hypothetical protein